MGTAALRKVQLGTEGATWGTAVAATGILSAVEDFNWRAEVTNQQNRFLAGTLSPSQKVTQTYAQGSASITQAATPEDLLYVLDAGFNAASTAGANPYTWTHSAPTTSQTITSRTLEFYDGTTCYEMDGALVNQFSISGALTDVWKVSSSWVGQSVTKTTVTGALNERTFTLIPTATTSVWIDDIGGTVGTTAVSATLIGFNLQVGTGVHLKTFMSGSVNPASYGKRELNGTLQLTLEANATGVGELDKFLAGTGRLIRIKGTNGTPYIQIDFAGDITNHDSAWGDRDGNTTLTLNLAGRYDSGAFANWLKITCNNAVSALVG